MKVKIKKLDPSAITPHYSSQGAAGIDIYAHDVKYIYNEGTKDEYTQYSLSELKYIEYGTKLAIEIPEGFVGLIYPRSSITEKDMMLGNSVGVVDSDYRGEIKFRFKPYKLGFKEYKLGEKIGQLVIMPFPKVELVESEELSGTERGSGGYGSTGK